MTSLAERILAAGRTNPIEKMGSLAQRILGAVPQTGALKAPAQTPVFPTPASAVPLWQKIIGGQQGETFLQTYNRVGAENTAATKAAFDPNASPELRKKGQDIYAGMTFGFTGTLQNVAKKGAVKGIQALKGSADDLTTQARKYKTAEEFVKAQTGGKFGDIKKIDINKPQEQAYISNFADKFQTQKSQASGLTYSTLDKMGSLNTALKQKGFKGVSNSADFKGIYSLDKVIDNPVLFDKYPDLKRVNVIFADFHTPTQRGVHIGNDIFLNSKLYAKDATNIESTLVHEIEHAIQDTKGNLPKYSNFEQGRGMNATEYTKDARENGARAKQQEYIDVVKTRSQLINIWNKAHNK